MSAPARLASATSTSWASASLRLAPVRFEPVRTAFSMMVSARSTPLRVALPRSAPFRAAAGSRR
jgi:hypothetical protein